MAFSLTSLPAADAAALRYQPKAGSKVAYEVEIVAELPNEIETLKGVIIYEVTTGSEILKLKYSGGLERTAKRKESAEPDFGPPRFPRPPIFGTPFGGIGQTANRISLTSQGKVQSLEGSSQLPYLLGNLSTFVFEPLSEADEKSWTSENGVSIFEDSSSGWPGRHFPPFRSSGLPDKTTAGSESVSLAFESDKGDVSTFKKTYRLNSAVDKESVDINGNGVWAFNRGLNVPESHDCKYTMVYKKETVTLNVPVTVKYRRLSDEELAKVEKEKEEQRQKHQVDSERRQAEQKAPLEGEERRKVLADLKANDVHTLISVLMKLSQKESRDDKEIASAVKRLMKHSDSMVRDSAGRALVKFAPALEQKIEINKEYSGMGSVNVTGPPVTAQTPLPRGLIVAANNFGPWYRSAKIIKKLDDGRVEVQLYDSHRTEILDITKIRLAPPEVDQPFVNNRVLERIYGSNYLGDAAADNEEEDDDNADADDDAAVSKADRGYRAWTDDTGTFAVVAKYVGCDGDKVRLQKKADGKEIKVPISRLSKSDRELTERLQKTPKASNPFE